MESNFKNISSTFDLSCQLFSDVSELITELPNDTLDQAEIDIARIKSALQGNGQAGFAQFNQLFVSSTGIAVGQSITDMLNSALSNITISITDPLTGQPIPVSASSVSDDNINLSGPLSLANFDPNAQVGFTIDGTYHDTDIGPQQLDSSMASWLPAEDPYEENPAEELVWTAVEWSENLSDHYYSNGDKITMNTNYDGRSLIFSGSAKTFESSMSVTVKAGAFDSLEAIGL